MTTTMRAALALTAALTLAWMVVALVLVLRYPVGFGGWYAYWWSTTGVVGGGLSLTLGLVTFDRFDRSS